MGEIKIGRMVIGSNGTNTYFLYREGSVEVIVIDPADRGEKISETLANNGYKVVAIFITHGHFDHIWGVKALQESLKEPVKIYACEAEIELLNDPYMNM